MSKPEKFRPSHDLQVDGLNTLASVRRKHSDKTWDRTLVKLTSYPITVSEARALRDWLNEVIP